MDLDYSDTKILGAGLIILAVVSLGYTYGVSQDINSFMSEDEVSNAIQEREDALVESFNEVVTELEGDINETQDSVDTVEGNVSDLKDRLNQSEQEVSDLKDRLNETETEVQELRDWISSQAVVEVTGYEDLGSQYEVSVTNSKLETVESVIVQAQLGNQTSSKLIDSIESGATETVTFSKPSTNHTATFEVQ